MKEKHGYRGESKKTGFTISVILGDFFLGRRRVLAGLHWRKKGVIQGLEADHYPLVYCQYQEELGEKAEEVEMIC